MPLIPRQEPVAAVAARVRSGREARPGAAELPLRPSSPGPDSGRDQGLPMAGLDEVLAGRSAFRSYGARRPTARRLAAVVALALDHHAVQWPADPHGPPPGVLLAAYDVVGLEPGFHRWKDAGTVGGFDTVAKAPPWFRDLQVRYCAVPAMFLMHGSPLRAGADGYGDLLVRVGSLGHALWLAARTYGLEACAFGGPSPEVTALLRTGDVTERHLFVVTAGYSGHSADALPARVDTR